jgi:hypothetical protein
VIVEYTCINHNLDHAVGCAQYPWEEFAWEWPHRRYLMGLLYGTWPKDGCPPPDRTMATPPRPPGSNPSRLAVRRLNQSYTAAAGLSALALQIIDDAAASVAFSNSGCRTRPMQSGQSHLMIVARYPVVGIDRGIEVVHCILVVAMRLLPGSSPFRGCSHAVVDHGQIIVRSTPIRRG